MTKEFIKAVYKYIGKYRCDPLHFDFPEGEEIVPNTNSLKELVIDCLNLTNEFNSFNSEGEIETFPRKARSVLDIWRHVIFYSPEIKIEEVIKILGENKKEVFVGHFCDDVLRRVFKLKINMPTWNMFSSRDEFGFRYPTDWENILDSEIQTKEEK